MPVAVIIINSNNDGDKEAPQSCVCPSSPRRRAGRRRRRGCPRGGRGSGCRLPPQNKRERRQRRERPRRTEGIVPRCAVLAGGFARGRCGGGKAAGLRGSRLSTGALGEDVSGRGCAGAGGSRSTRGRSAEGKGGEGVYRPVRGGGSILGHPTAASSGRCSVRAGTPATGVGSPRVGSRWVRSSRGPATDTSFSPPPSPHPQVSRDPLRAAAMSRRSQRLVTTRYYPGDDDATTSSSSTSLLGGTQLPFKETTGRLVGGSPCPNLTGAGHSIPHQGPGTFLGEVWG